jgi:hypothetical protein
MEPWSLYIDIEGFGAKYEKDIQPLVSLGALMEAIYLIGTRCFAKAPNRIFVHQLGDGFIIGGEFGKESLQDPLSIGIALMRHVLSAGGVAKAAISEGKLGDIVDCYPKVLAEEYARSYGGAFALGEGLMTILPVMGTALINAYRLLDSLKTPSGSFIIVKKSDLPRLPANTKATEVDEIGVVDWIHTSYPELEKIIKQAGLRNPNVEQLERSMDVYLKSNKLSEEWSRNTRSYLNL